MALSGYTKVCAKHTPGIQELWLGAKVGWTSGTITNSAGAVEVTELVQDLVKWEFDIDGVKVEENGTGTKGGLFYVEKTIEIKISKLNDAMLVAFRNLANASPCGLCAGYKTNNGYWYCAGFEIEGDEATSTALSFDRGFYLETSPINTGNDPTEEEADMVTVTLKGTFNDYSYIVDPDSTITVNADPGVVTET